MERSGLENNSEGDMVIFGPARRQDGAYVTHEELKTSLDRVVRIVSTWHAQV